MTLSTLCYIEKDGAYLMLHRVKKAHDVNKGKWIGVGGKFLPGESPDECLRREVWEETGLRLGRARFRGVITFCCNNEAAEYIFLFTADEFTGQLASDCDEGVLRWVPKAEVEGLALWPGDRIFLRLLAADHPPFSLKLVYQGDALLAAVLDGRAVACP